MKKLKSVDILKFKGKTRKEIIELLGNDFHPESTGENILVYVVNKTWIKFCI